jgi:hypothetical protein
MTGLTVRMRPFALMMPVSPILPVLGISYRWVYVQHDPPGAIIRDQKTHSVMASLKTVLEEKTEGDSR